MQLEWEVVEKKEFDKKINELTGSATLSQILANRGIDTYEKAKLFLNPQSFPTSDFANFLDMQKAVERIKEAVEKGQNIVICGDFDCDGVTSTAVLYKTLIKVGAKVGCYIPNRQNENHGLNSKAIIEIISKQKAKLIITVDNGISNNTEIKLAQSLGTDVIITDHHEPSENLPEAFAILNPKCSNKISENLEFIEIENMTHFAGVMVAYKLCCALLKEFKIKDFNDEILPLVMLGTISDVMPLTMENRSIVSKGLEIWQNNPPRWLKKMFELASRSLERLDSETVAFTVAPRINAAGRLEQATTALELLVTEEDEKIDFCANQLQQFNQTRQQMCDTFFYEASVRIQNEIDLKTTKAIVLADEKWHIGIVGLLASRIVETYNRPAFIMSIDKEENKARCSIRGIKGLSIHAVLSEMEDAFETYGGHELAGGFGADLSKISVKELARRINQIVSQNLDNEALKRKITIDSILEEDELTPEFIEKLALLEPYGEGNKPCLFGMKDMQLKKFDILGNNAHMKFFFEAPNCTVFEGIIWNKNSHIIEILDKTDLTFVPKINEFKGKKSVQLMLKNIYITSRDVEKKNTDFDENAKIQAVLVDHRKKTDFFKMLNSYLSNNNANVFLEGKNVAEQITDYSAIKSAVRNRFALEGADELIILSAPCSDEIFSNIIKSSTPNKVHVFNCNEKKLEITEIIKTISGMLKYCVTHNDGKIEIEKSLSYLAITNDAFSLALELLQDCKIIEISSKDDFFYEFKFLESKPLAALLHSTKYKELELEIEKINNFKEEYQTCDILQIKEMIDA